MKTKTISGKNPSGKKERDKDIAAAYNEFKLYEGKQYTGMKVGRGHKWYYDRGEWKERKVRPDKWEFTYSVTKRRAGKAPEGSGVPAVTEYHWYILAHQNVRKLDANNYTTSMAGYKYKIAHKRAAKERWSASERAQRKKLISVLQELIGELTTQLEESAPRKKQPAKTRKRTIRKRAEVAEPAYA